jgi:hypothetical protein
MRASLDTYEQAVMDRICAVCIERRDDGTCGIDPRIECAVRTHLPTLIDKLSGVSSDRIGDYVERVRRNVCAVCNQGTPADCDNRARVDCVLDRYLTLVAEAIEEVERIRAGEAQASAP